MVMEGLLHHPFYLMHLTASARRSLAGESGSFDDLLASVWAGGETDMDLSMTLISQALNLQMVVIEVNPYRLRWYGVDRQSLSECPVALIHHQKGPYMAMGECLS